MIFGEGAHSDQETIRRLIRKNSNVGKVSLVRFRGVASSFFKEESTYMSDLLIKQLTTSFPIEG